LRLPRVALLLVPGLIGCLLATGCATDSMWRRQIRQASAAHLTGDTEGAREDLDVALTLAESPVRDPYRVAGTLATLAEIEITAESWEAAERHLRLAIAANAERGEEGDPWRLGNLLRLRWVLMQHGRVDAASQVHRTLLESLGEIRAKVESPSYDTRQNFREAFGAVEASFGQELAEAGHPELALEAFEAAGGYGLELNLIREGNAEFALARAEALAGVGREQEAEGVRREAEAVRARSDYVEAALLDRGDFAIVARWRDDAMPLRIHVSKPPAGFVRDPDAARQIVKDAAVAWLDVAREGVPAFVFVRKLREADIVVRWVHDRTFFGPVGLCRYDAHWEDEPLKGAKITMMSRIMGRYLSDEQLRHVAIHEVGHALGLLGHSGRESDIMYPSVPRDPLTMPSDRDRRTVRRLYESTPGHSYNP
jgi:hypothetical protein